MSSSVDECRAETKDLKQKSVAVKQQLDEYIKALYRNPRMNGEAYERLSDLTAGLSDAISLKSTKWLLVEVGRKKDAMSNDRQKSLAANEIEKEFGITRELVVQALAERGLRVSDGDPHHLQGGSCVLSIDVSTSQNQAGATQYKYYIQPCYTWAGSTPPGDKSPFDVPSNEKGGGVLPAWGCSLGESGTVATRAELRPAFEVSLSKMVDTLAFSRDGKLIKQLEHAQRLLALAPFASVKAVWIDLQPGSQRAPDAQTRREMESVLKTAHLTLANERTDETVSTIKLEVSPMASDRGGEAWISFGSWGSSNYLYKNHDDLNAFLIRVARDIAEKTKEARAARLFLTPVNRN